MPKRPPSRKINKDPKKRTRIHTVHFPTLQSNLPNLNQTPTLSQAPPSKPILTGFLARTPAPSSKPFASDVSTNHNMAVGLPDESSYLKILLKRDVLESFIPKSAKSKDGKLLKNWWITLSKKAYQGIAIPLIGGPNAVIEKTVRAFDPELPTDLRRECRGSFNWTLYIPPTWFFPSRPMAQMFVYLSERAARNLPIILAELPILGISTEMRNLLDEHLPEVKKKSELPDDLSERCQRAFSKAWHCVRAFYSDNNLFYERTQVKPIPTLSTLLNSTHLYMPVQAKPKPKPIPFKLPASLEAPAQDESPTKVDELVTNLSETRDQVDRNTESCKHLWAQIRNLAKATGHKLTGPNPGIDTPLSFPTSFFDDVHLEPFPNPSSSGDESEGISTPPESNSKTNYPLRSHRKK